MPVKNRRDFNIFNLSLLGAVAGASLSLPISAFSKSPSSASRDVVTSIDCHAHIFHRGLPMPDRRRAPGAYDATAEDFLGVMKDHKISHGVLIQPSFLGTDNSYMVAALKKYPKQLRGVAVVDPSISSQDLDALQAAGIVGIRLNLIGLPTPDFHSDLWKNLLKEIKVRRWQVEVHQVIERIAAVVEPLLAAGIDVVIDHFGRPNEKLGVEDRNFKYLLALGSTRQVWVKLSGSYRNGKNGVGEETAKQAIPLLISHFGLERLLWGSDWPHTLFESSVNYSSQRQLLDQWLPRASDRLVVLRDTPQSLFGFNV
jgi:predicted TIM-barrel fold metal-dependent hydrolase